MSGGLRTRLLLTGTLLAQLGAGPAGAALLLVPEEQPTIAAALAAASYGDTVSLAPGTYYEHDLVLPPGVSLVGRSSSPQVVIIDAQELGRVLVGEDLDERNLLACFTARAGNAQWPGAGLYLSGACTLRNLIVEDCIGSGSGVGAHCRYPTLIEDCIFRNNGSSSSVSAGGGLYIATNWVTGSTVRRTDFIGNESLGGAGFHAEVFPGLVIEQVRVLENIGRSAVGFYWGEVGAAYFLIEDATIANNTGMGIEAIASGTVRNCTIVDCRGGVMVQGSWAQSSYVHVDNCLIAFNLAEPEEGGVCSIFGEYPGVALVSCSNVYKNLPVNYFGTPDQTGINGNISVDPRFCDGAGPEDYPLRKDSPCAPENNTCGVLMGAFPVGCDATAVEATSWGHIKSLY